MSTRTLTVTINEDPSGGGYRASIGDRYVLAVADTEYEAGMRALHLALTAEDGLPAAISRLEALDRIRGDAVRHVRSDALDYILAGYRTGRPQ